ncbi:hypothetical protein SAMD00019534_045220, partial [Acytostelium subglobosum LB1]|uniref:hypothetical protein n=1 Tax=Acytostelium subglobosum LB1 TaxID=1410327 RepID=UPI000644EF86
IKEFGDKEYWDERYEKDKKGRPHFDWYHGWYTLEPFLSKYLKREDCIMMLGCGNSKLGEDLNDNHYTNIVNIDFSEVLIEDMKQRTQGRTGLEYITMDGRHMTFANESFDSVFDKGTIDAVMCSDDDNSNARMMIAEVARVLRPGGFFIVMTYGSPESRLPILDVPSLGWTVHLRLVGTHSEANINECHYVYIMHKHQVADSPTTAHIDPSKEVFDVYLNSSVGKIALEVTPIVK